LTGFALRRLGAAVLALGLAACATLPPEIPEVAECRANYLGLDERVDAAGVRNGGAHTIEGFPYLRSDRFLASFRGESGEPAVFAAWVERLRQLDLQTREAELRNLGWADPAEELSHLDRCGKEWAARDLEEQPRRWQLRAAAGVPDDYSWLRRALGLYPLVVPFLNLGIGGFNKEVQADYAKPLEALDSPGPLVLWQPQSPRPAGAPSGVTSRDPLRIPILTAEQWRTLAAAHAPTWLVETTGDFDRLGTPQLEGDEIAFDAARPVTHFVPGYTRFGRKVLVQLSYIVWFSERPKRGWIDSYAGTLDGVVWRVTLDVDGRPLLYDTIHACGCYHYYYLAKPLKRKEQGSSWQEPVLFPQDAPAEPFAIRLQSGTHYVRRLVPLKEFTANQVATYASADYAELLSLPDGAGGSRSLFCEDGLACGTERFERFWLWPAGIKSPGAMRQWGRHATSFVGRSHFDDPGMLDRLFEPR